MVDGARGVLNALLADVFVFTDAASGAASGNSPGYGAVLVAETTSGALISAEACATQVWGGRGPWSDACAEGRAAGRFDLACLLASSWIYTSCLLAV
jgi:RNA 3'-terminal phosphate cyclase